MLYTLRKTIWEYLQQYASSFTTAILAMWFAFWHRRVQWHVKLILLSAILYVASPFDLIRDSILFLGQIDDIVMLRVSYWICRKLMDPAILEECRTRAAGYLDAGEGKTVRFLLAVLLIWGLVLFLAVKYLTHKLGS